MITVHPVGQKILIEPDFTKQEVVVDSIILPFAGNATLARGVVVEAAPMFKEVYAKGDVILYIEKTGIGVVSNNKPHILLDGGNHVNTQGDIIAIIKEA
jgi:hypothetical protein